MKHENIVSFARSISFIRRAIYCVRLREDRVRPVVKMSISIMPVSGSTADLSVAKFIN